MSLFLLLLSLHSLSKELSPSILIFHEWDLNDCKTRLDKALSFNPKNIQFLLTSQFIANDKKELQSFCYLNQNAECEPGSDELKGRIQGKIYQCLKNIPEDISLHINIHLNDSTDKSLWRNELLFDPLKEYGGISYTDFLIHPFIKTLNKLGLNKPIYFSLQGEMGATIFKYPISYKNLLNQLQLKHPNFKFGISLNYNAINGGVKTNKYSREVLNKLFKKIDFLGISAYQPFKISHKNKIFHKTINHFHRRLEAEGVFLKIDTPIQFTEFGLGGGNWINDGKTPGQSIKEITNAPYAGLYTFNGQSPWDKNSHKKLRRKYYKYLLNFLNNQKRVKHVFQWNAGSWDIHGIYPGTEHFSDESFLLKLNDTSK